MLAGNSLPSVFKKGTQADAKQAPLAELKIVKKPTEDEFKAEFEIRVAKKEEVVTMMDLARKEKWNVGTHDAEAYYQAFPEGCKVLVHKTTGTLIGGIFIATYENKFNFIGLFIVKEQYRGFGLGDKLWQYAMRFIDQQNCGLFAVPAQVDRYKKSGFQNAYKTERWTYHCEKPKEDKENNTNLLPLTKDDALLGLTGEYDATLFPRPRFALIKQLINSQHGIGFVIKDKNQVVGYAVIRPCQINPGQNGFRVGPLYGNNPDIAKQLAEKLLKLFKGEIILDAYGNNKYFIRMAEYFNLLKRDESANLDAMFNGQESNLMKESTDKRYAVATLELG